MHPESLGLSQNSCLMCFLKFKIEIQLFQTIHLQVQDQKLARE